MKLNREEIIKALESYNSNLACEECECLETWCALCSHTLVKNALALIKELTETVELGEVRVALAEANNDKKKLLEEIEELEKTNEYYSELEQGCYVTGVKNVTADTVRKMQEALEQRIHSKLSYHGWYLKETVIAEIAKEMLEG